MFVEYPAYKSVGRDKNRSAQFGPKQHVISVFVACGLLTSCASTSDVFDIAATLEPAVNLTGENASGEDAATVALALTETDQSSITAMIEADMAVMMAADSDAAGDVSQATSSDPSKRIEMAMNNAEMSDAGSQKVSEDSSTTLLGMLFGPKSKQVNLETIAEASVAETGITENVQADNRVSSAHAEAAIISASSSTEINVESIPPHINVTKEKQPKRSFLSALFGERTLNSTETPDSDGEIPVVKPRISPQALRSNVQTASLSSPLTGVLPGVRENDQLFDIIQQSGSADNSDIDLFEEEETYQLASAGGLARLAPHGLLKQRDDVDVSCFKPELVRLIKTIESHYRKPAMITSGFRSPKHNKRVRGARNSAHMTCTAADLQVEGVSKWEIAKFVRNLPNRGGVGTYCHTKSVHIDTGPVRDWDWRCGKGRR